MLAIPVAVAVFFRCASPTFATKIESSTIVTISGTDFVASRFPWGTNFTGTNPLPDKAGQSCGEDLGSPSMNSVRPCSYLSNDSYLAKTMPSWLAAQGSLVTRPWTNGFSSPRLLGGLATHDPKTNTWTPNLDFEVVRRAPDGKTFVYNWTRIDRTLDGFVVAKTERFLIVLDNIPYAFVKPENRFYLSYGLGSAPDDPQEFADFVGKFAEHLVERYGLQTVSKWRFRLGTECDGLYAHETCYCTCYPHHAVIMAPLRPEDWSILAKFHRAQSTFCHAG